MIYDVRQTTTCVYASPVAHAHHVLRLMPINRPGQRVHVAALQIGPEPAHRREGKDFFGNRLTWIDVEEPHKTLSVKLTARVTVDALVEPAPLSSPAWEAVREAAFATSDIGPLSPAHFLFPSRMVSLDPEIRDYTRESFRAERPVLDAAIELMNRLKSDIVYEIGATTVTTTPPMSFALRRGVCQDFAHIMISGLRRIGARRRAQITTDIAGRQSDAPQSGDHNVGKVLADAAAQRKRHWRRGGDGGRADLIGDV